jgi:glutamyl-tRNA reductase
MDKLLLIGVNHKVAPVALRERLAFNAEGVVQAVKALRARLPGESEVALLSTCNRTELILHVDDPCEAEETGREFLSETGHLSGEILADVLYVYSGCEAARHLLRVAAGLDSLVVGENEIQGQVRTAYELAQSAGTSGPLLNTLFRMAVQNGKQVRAETDIGKTKLSVASVVVELATEQLGDLQQHTALLIGAGKISTLTARELVRAGLRCVLVANRTFRRAQNWYKAWEPSTPVQCISIG